MNIELDLTTFLQTSDGQEIAKAALVEAFNKQASQYFADRDLAVSNIAHYVVENVIGLSVSELKQEIEAKVQQRITKDGGLGYFEQNKVLKTIVDTSVRDNQHLVKNKVLEKLEDSATYEHLSWSLADAIIKLIREAV